LIVDPDFGDVATTLEAKSIGVGSGIRVEECSATNGPTATEQRGNALLGERIFVKGGITAGHAASIVAEARR
jgi:hypothetical protein